MPEQDAYYKKNGQEAHLLKQGVWSDGCRVICGMRCCTQEMDFRTQCKTQAAQVELFARDNDFIPCSNTVDLLIIPTVQPKHPSRHLPIQGPPEAGA